MYTITIISIFSLVVTITVAVFFLYKKLKEDSNGKFEHITEGNSKTQDKYAMSATINNNFAGMKTRQLCKALLNELNCKVIEFEEDPDRIEFMFQGESFCLIATDDSLMVTVYDFSWGSINLDDIDEVSKLRKVINSVNFKLGGVCVIYTMDVENNRMIVHTKRQFFIIPEIPNLVEYLTAMLTGFFEAQRVLTHELDKERVAK